MDKRQLRMLFVVVSAVVFVDTIFYSAVVPLLPTLTASSACLSSYGGTFVKGLTPEAHPG
jgi:hypothetical protein